MPSLEVYFTLHHNMFVYSTSLLILVTVQRAQRDKRMVGVVYAASYLFDFSLTKIGKEIHHSNSTGWSDAGLWSKSKSICGHPVDISQHIYIISHPHRSLRPWESKWQGESDKKSALTIQLLLEIFRALNPSRSGLEAAELLSKKPPFELESAGWE